MNIFFDNAPLYWGAGLPVMPCTGKRPIIDGWTDYASRMPTPEEQADWLANHENRNLGLPLGSCSGLVAVDIDTDDPTEIAAIRACLPESPCIRIGKKGMVLFFRWNGQRGFKVRTPDGRQPVEFLSVGNQVILAPSIHPDTGQPYFASANLWEVLNSIPELPHDFGKQTLMNALGIVGKRKLNSKSVVKEGARHSALVSFAAQIRNQGMEGPAFLDKLHERNATFAPPLPEDEVAAIGSWGATIEGCDGFSRSESGKILPKNQSNIRQALELLGIALSYDAFAGKYLIEGLPDHEGLIDDAAVRRVWFLVQEQFGFQPTKEFFWEAVLDLAHQCSFDPVCRDLDRLQLAWDGTARLDDWLVRYGAAQDTAYNRAVGGLVLIAAVRRARQAGVKFDNMLVLNGPQGCGKSTAVKVLAGEDSRFSDQIPFNAEGREVIEALSGRWIVETGELHGLRNASAERLKSFLSRTVDHGRAAFARTTQAVPRRCIFIGTTNAANFLTDGTGNRRYWPVTVGNFDLEALERDRDQLIGEASVREAIGESLTLPETLWVAAAAEQEARRIENPIVSALEASIGNRTGRIRSVDVWELLKIPTAQQHAMASSVSSAMQELGWDGGKHRFGNRSSERGYARGDHLERQQVLSVSAIGLILPQHG